MKKIPLTQGKYALVDDADYEKVSKYKWHVKKQPRVFYACADIGGRKNRIRLRMHRFILNAPLNMDVDHINHNGLDNRRCNLRVCTRRQNIQNCRKQKAKKTTSHFKGVHWHIRAKKWQARIFINNKYYSLGLFASEVDAAKAYDIAAIKNYKEYANTNFKKGVA